MKYHHISCIFLVLGFLVSAAYQYYRSTIHEVPEYDDFGFKEISIYTFLIAISLLVLFNKKWILKFIVGFCTVGCGIAFFYYLPVILPARTVSWIDILESIIYLICIICGGIFAFVALHKRKSVNDH